MEILKAVYRIIGPASRRVLQGESVDSATTLQDDCGTNSMIFKTWDEAWERISKSSISFIAFQPQTWTRKTATVINTRTVESSDWQKNFFVKPLQMLQHLPSFPNLQMLYTPLYVAFSSIN